MALQKEYTKMIYGNKINFPEAYFKIEYIEGDKDNISFMLVGYSNYEKKDVVFQLEYNFTPSVEYKADNFIKQGYDHLKTLPEYANALDVLE